MKKIASFFLACLMIVSSFTFAASAVQPRWSNTMDIVLAHDAVGTTAHCVVDIGIYKGSTMMNVSIRLADLSANPTQLVKEWEDPEFTVDGNNTYSFYGTVENIIPGHTYRLIFQCEVWHNGVCDYISQGVNAVY